jgi:hypothetical protein
MPTKQEEVAEEITGLPVETTWEVMLIVLLLHPVLPVLVLLEALTATIIYNHTLPVTCGSVPHKCHSFT